MPDSPATYEKRDVDLRMMLWCGLGVTIGVYLAFLAVGWLYRSLEGDRPIPTQSNGQLSFHHSPPDPKLQLDPSDDLRVLRREEDKVLNTYGWVNRKEGVVRIPVDRAMDLMVPRGLPVTQSNKPPTTP